jgi:hypothetical protein
METTFTPGPWLVEKNEHAFDVCRYLPGDDLSNGRRYRQTIASKLYVLPNASLIAAAPDMYEELECARDVFRFYQSHHEFKGGTEKAIRNKEIADRIDRLLVKARGEI